MSIQTISEGIRRRRKDLRITQRELAELAGISANSLSKLERRTGNTTLDVLTRICDILGLELALKVKTQSSSS